MKRILAALIATILSLAVFAGPTPTTMINAATATGAGSVFVTAGTASGSQVYLAPLGPIRVFQAYGTTSAGAGAAVIEVQGSNDGTNFFVLCSITLTLATTITTTNGGTGGCVSNATWPYLRGNVLSISGTSAAVTLTVGAQ